MKPLTLPQELRRHSARFWFVVSPSTKSLLERAAARIEELERPMIRTVNTENGTWWLKDYSCTLTPNSIHRELGK